MLLIVKKEESGTVIKKINWSIFLKILINIFENIVKILTLKAYINNIAERGGKLNIIDNCKYC